MSKLQDRVAIVTGGHRGIGRGIAEAFAREGADVAIVDVYREDDAAPVLAEIERSGREGLFVPADVSREGDVRRAVDRVLEAWVRIDILVNNAGILGRMPLTDMTVEEWDRVIAVNLQGVLVNAIAPGPIATGIMPSTLEAERFKLAQLPIHRFGRAVSPLASA